jgi:hypothetical protein
MTFLRLQSAVTFLEGDDVWETNDEVLAERRVRGATVLISFDRKWMKEAIVTLAQIMRLIKDYKKIRMYSVGSYPCENFFA